MIDRTHDLPVIRQCQILQLARSTAYYTLAPVAPADLALMRRIDELHLDYPFAGSRMLRDMLRQEGQAIGRKHVSTLMKKMGIEALYRKPNTSRRHAAHPIYPYLLRNLKIDRPNQVLGDGDHLHPDAPGLRLSGGHRRLAQPPRARLAALQYAGHEFLRRCPAGSDCPVR